MNVSLTPQLEEFVARKVREGTYQTASEVIREALRLLGERDERRAAELQRLRSELKLGLEDVAAGRKGGVDVRKIKAEGRKLLAARRLKNVG
jgi:antitoxin ParD1/3/4